MAWDTGWQSPEEQAAEQAAAAQAAQLAKASPFERELLSRLGDLAESFAALVDVTARRQPAGPICKQCGAEQPIAGSVPVTFDDRRDRAVNRLAAEFPERPWPVWARVVDLVLTEMQWMSPTVLAASSGQVDAAGVGDVDSAGPPEHPPVPGPARPNFTEQ